MQTEKKTKESVAWTDIAKSKQERILLMPYHLSANQEGECLHLVPVPGTAVMVVCHNWTEENCGCCEKPTCSEHFSERVITLEHERINGTYPLCLECSKLPRVHIEAIFKLQIALNEP